MEPRIKQSLNDLRMYRTKSIIDLLYNISKRQKKIIINQVSVNKSSIWGASDIMEIGSDYKSWRFKTNVENFYGMYYEQWLPYEFDIYYLDRIYLHIYKTNVTELRSIEYLLLHCDANEPDEAPHAVYKQSPHLHFAFAEQPIPHSHIALNNGNLMETLHSIDSLHIALKHAINMIETQVLDPIKKMNSYILK